MKLIELKIDETKGAEVKAISLVSEPAIEIDYKAFSKSGKSQPVISEVSLAKADTEKRIVTGAALIPNKHILRVDEKTNEPYHVFFSESTVANIAKHYLKTLKLHQVNVEHDSDSFLEGVYIVESWIVENPDLDKSKALGFSDIPKGTWFISMKVEDESVWQNLIKTGEAKGFSIEGSFIESLHQFSAQKSETDEMKDLINKIFGFTKTENKAYIVESQITESQKKVRKIQNLAKVTLAETVLEDGTKLTTEAADFSVGAEVFVTTAENEKLPAPDGEYTTPEGVTFTIVEGKVTESSVEAPSEEIEEVEAAEVTEEETPVNDVEALLTQIVEGIATLSERVGNIEHTVAELAGEKQPTEEEILSEAEVAELSALRTEVVQLKAQVTELEKKPAAVSLKKEVANTTVNAPVQSNSIYEKVMNNLNKK